MSDNRDKCKITEEKNAEKIRKMTDSLNRSGVSSDSSANANSAINLLNLLGATLKELEGSGEFNREYIKEYDPSLEMAIKTVESLCTESFLSISRLLSGLTAESAGLLVPFAEEVSEKKWTAKWRFLDDQDDEEVITERLLRP
jgi:hypothetical protein